MEITKEQFLRYTETIMEVVHGELSNYEYNRILEIVQKARTENELNKLILDYKEQIKQSLQIVAHTLGHELTLKQEKLVRKAIENSRGDKSALMYELQECAENMKRGITKSSTKLQEAFRYIESSIERELEANEVQVIVRIVERNDEDRTSLIYELNKYKVELLEKDFTKGIGQNKLPKRLTDNNKAKKHNKSKTRKKRNIKGAKTAKKATKAKGKKAKRKRMAAAMAAGIIGVGAVAGAFVVANDRKEEPVQFSDEKIEKLENKEHEENIEVIRLNHSYEYDLKIERLSCEQVKSIAKRSRDTLYQVLTTKINENLNEKDYKRVGYGYDNNPEFPNYYVSIGDKRYTDEMFASKKISGEVKNIVKRMLKLDEIIQARPDISKLQKNAEYLAETIEYINNLKDNKEIYADSKKIVVIEREKKAELENQENNIENER